VREHRALGATGRPRGVEDDGRLLFAGVGRRRGGRARFEELVEPRGPGCGSGADPDGERQPLCRGRQAVGERGVEHDRLRAALGEDEGELGALLADVHRAGHGAEPQHGEQGVDELAVVGQEQHDPVAARDAEPVEVAREPVGDAVELPVVEAVPVGDERLAVAVTLDGRGEEGIQVLRPFGEAAQLAAEVHFFAQGGDVGPVHGAANVTHVLGLAQ